MNHENANKILKNKIQDYAVFMLNPKGNHSDFMDYGLEKIDDIKSFLDEHKKEIDIHLLKEYLDSLSIKIFNKEIQKIEKEIKKINQQSSNKNAKNFEQELESLFNEKKFATYSLQIYDVPTIAKEKLEQILKNHNQPLHEMVNDRLFARLVATTVIRSIQTGKTDEGYPFENHYVMGINFLAVEILSDVLKNQKDIKDILIEKNQSFKNSTLFTNKGKIYTGDLDSRKTLFQTLSENLLLCYDFQNGMCYSFSENYYLATLKLLNLCLCNMQIDSQTIDDFNLKIKEVQNFFEKEAPNEIRAIKKELVLMTKQINSIQSKYTSPQIKTIKIR